MICEQENITVMLSSITWAKYFSTTALLLICYYIFIGFRYYKWEILSIIGIKKVEESRLGTIVLPNFKNLVVTENHEDYLPKHNLEIDISPLVQSFTDEVQAYVQEACENKIQKKEMLHSLQIIASKYPALKDADCRDEFTQLVLNAVNKQYPNLLQPNDVNQIWN